MAVADFNQVVEQNHQALGAFSRENHEPLAKLWSQQDDVTLAPASAIPQPPHEPQAWTFEDARDQTGLPSTAYKNGRTAASVWPG